jgi:hypothetical protein
MEMFVEGDVDGEMLWKCYPAVRAVRRATGQHWPERYGRTKLMRKPSGSIRSSTGFLGNVGFGRR